MTILVAAVAAANVFAQTDNVATAKTFIESLAKNDFNTAESYFNDEVKAQLSVEKLKEVWQSINAHVGNFKKQGDLQNNQNHIIKITLEFGNANLDAVISFDINGKIGGLNFVPAGNGVAAKVNYETPVYAKPNLFQEKDVTVGTGEWALPATLTMPVGNGNFPAVVLVHGSGANDRDETINVSNKPFKDLAWGLASRGIAVLRYDKRNFVHGAQLAKVKNFTLNEETVDDALFAVNLLRQTPNIDSRRIFVLGHSLGGMAIPRIGARDAKIAGLIVFAGTARPLEDVILEQYTYLFSLDGAISPEKQALLDQTKADVAKIKALKPADINSDKMYLRFFPVPYLLDLQNYNPPLVAEKLKQPMLILQGGRDYQVTIKDFQNWKNALGKKRNVTFKTYPTLTHLFMEGSEKPTPADYQKISHVDENVINDITNWILKPAGK